MPQPHDQMPFRLFRKAQLYQPDGANEIRIRVMEPLGFLEEARQLPSVTIIINDHNYMYHYFHFMEVLLALWAFEKHFLQEGRIGRILLTSPHWTNPRQHHIQRALMALLFPGVRIDTPSAFQPEIIDNVVLIDRNLAVTAINKFLEPVQWLAGLFTPSLVDTVFRGLGVSPRSAVSTLADGPRALYVRRSPPRRLSDAAEAELLARLPELGMRVDVIDYAALSWEDQIRSTAGYDALIGVHGNGLTNLLWLPAHAGVLEIFPAGAHHYDYQLMAELKHLAYVGIEGKVGGFVYRDFSRHGDAHGHGPECNDREVNELPWLAISQFVALTRSRLEMAAGLTPGSGQARDGLILL